MPKTLLLSQYAFLDHKPPRHPESPVRLEAILKTIQSSPYSGRLELKLDRLATREELLLNHTPRYLDEVLALDGLTAELDPETLLSPGSVKAARMAAGLGLELVEQVLSGKARNGFALVRPPGHHAAPDGGMGFCIFNNIAIAAHKALSLGAKRILILDWDVHHGNGTQDSFYEDDRVLQIDLHQENLFPSSSGLLPEIGRGKGLGYTANLPLPHSCEDLDYLQVFRKLVQPLAKEYRPELILVSAGFDAHISDPLASMSLSTAGFGLLARNVVRLANELCNGKVVLFLEGGYTPDALAQNVLACVTALAHEGSPHEAHSVEDDPNALNIGPHFEEIETRIRKIYELRSQIHS